MYNEEIYPSLATRSGDGTWKELQNNHLKMYCSKIVYADVRSNILGMKIHVKVLHVLRKGWRFSYWEKINIAIVPLIIHKIDYTIFFKYQNRNINTRVSKM